ncbi:MAG: YeeE/YedE family protein [Thermodesulfovibrionales bacterium]
METVIIILLCGILLGFLFHRSDYCMAGMFRDLFLFKNSPILRIFFIQISITLFLFYLARNLDLITFYPPPNLREASLSTLLGGFIFGTGMVLAGGCVIGTLYKMGAGSSGAIASFLGLVIGSGLYAEVYPLFNNLHRNTIFSDSVLLGQIYGEGLFLPLMLLSGVLIYQWTKKGKLYQRSYADGYIQPVRTAIFIALINLIIYIASGTPMAISTAYAKLSAFIERFIAPSHYESLEFFKRLSYSVNVPFDGHLISGGPGAVIDHVFIAEMPLLSGVILGSMFSSISLKEFRPFKNRPPLPQLFSAFIGGLLLGFSSRMAGGCNVKFLMSGLPLLSIQGIVFLGGLLPGTYAGTWIFKNLVLKLRR